MEQVFDRLVEFDERSREFPIRAVAPVAYRSYTWTNFGMVLNQFREGACVGFAWGQELLCMPKAHKGVTNETARSIYKRAQHLDQWAGEGYEGTSVIAGAKTAQEFGYITEYRWAFSLNDLIAGVGSTGPAILGVNWWSGMTNTDKDGYVKPTGVIVGGHAIVCIGVSTRYKRFTLVNSWGKHWGWGGKCYLSFDDMDALLHQDGEACFPIGRKVVPHLR